MQINSDTIRTAAFTVRYRLSGFKLLQNPKGTNPNEVTMIKTRFGINPDYMDKFCDTIRIHRKKIGDEFVKEKTEMFSEYLMNPETWSYSGKNKNIMLFRKSKFANIFREKEAMSFSEKMDRPLPKWISENEQYEFEKELFEEHRKKERDEGHYLHRPSLLARMVTLGMWREILGYNADSRAVQPSFWQVLKTNLNGGGIHTKDKEPKGGLWRAISRILK